MMMLKTFNQNREDAVDLIHRYIAWKRSDVDNVLKHKDPATRQQLEILSDQAKAYAANARALIAAGGIGQDEVDDLTAIAEELEIAAAEAEAESHPDSAWSSLDEHTKRRVTQHVPIARDKADRIRARMRGDLRKQTPKK